MWFFSRTVEIYDSRYVHGYRIIPFFLKSFDQSAIINHKQLSVEQVNNVGSFCTCEKTGELSRFPFCRTVFRKIRSRRNNGNHRHGDWANRASEHDLRYILYRNNYRSTILSAAWPEIRKQTKRGVKKKKGRELFA